MSPTPLDARVAALLRDLGLRLRRGSHEAARQSDAQRRLASGLPDLDALTGGGFPAGRLCEIAGPDSSGRTSIALALLAHTTGAGEWSALVDAADALDPASAQAAGVALERVLWVRPPAAREAARACARLLDVRGFALVLLDLARPSRECAPLPTAVWQRLARSAAATSCVVLAQQRVTGTHSELALEMRRARAHFSGTPALLEGMEIEARLVRQRAAPLQRVASLRLRAASRAA